jgi:hypothetical protein
VAKQDGEIDALKDPIKIKKREFQAAHIQGSIEVKRDLKNDALFEGCLPKEGESKTASLFYNLQDKRCKLRNLQHHDYVFPKSTIIRKNGSFYIKLGDPRDADNWEWHIKNWGPTGARYGVTWENGKNPTLRDCHRINVSENGVLVAMEQKTPLKL